MRTEKKKGLTSSKYPEENCHHFHLSGDGNARGWRGMWGDALVGKGGTARGSFPHRESSLFARERALKREAE